MSIYAISGGAGFLGAAIATQLGRAGHQVRVLDDLSGPCSAKRAEAFDPLSTIALTIGDVRDPAVCAAVCAGADFVLHYAAPPDSAGNAPCADVIVGGALRLMEASLLARTVKRFLLASSGAVYGDGPAMSRHEAALPEPGTPRACAVLSAEHFCQAAFRREGLQTVCLRYFDVYGPGIDLDLGSDGPPIAALIQAAATGSSVVLHGESDIPRDYLYVDDAVEAALRAAAAQRGVGGKVFNVGSGQRYSAQQAREILEGLTGRPLTIQRLPVRPGDHWQGRADIAAAAGLLQFTANIGLNDGLARTLHWAEERTVREQELCHA